MQNRIDIYINKEFKQAFDELAGIAGLESKKISPMIGQAVKDYVSKLHNEPNLIIEPELWTKALSGKSKSELMEIDTLITRLHRTVVEQLCKKR